MTTLPTGTVSLLFSDIEGSTALLKRLGPAYADALDSQRSVLRKAWADHNGIELGTEGDSFYVVFPTAESAVAAATQAQRDLAGFEWPGGEQVRVRMGIHTGSPTVHDEAYVGMDVHRAARIAGAAHGGQVLLSTATAELVSESLPEQVRIKDLGHHQLKDITKPEHLMQLAIEGLRSQFPPPKTLGTTSSLPRPATPLVGRDGELAELSALLSSPDVRLVTLTGPGGSGKTRLAIGVAERLVDRFPDGVYFVALAAATTADVMWTSIGEVLDVPPEGRIPPGFFDHVAHRTALFVLDNLEQIPGADDVVAELLDHAHQTVVIATTRRQLSVPGEHVHAVPALELPNGATSTEVAGSGAVQMFAQHATMAKASFTVNAENAADVVAVCRHLDGLPLAIELAAARIRLLSPAALLARLDKALDISSSSSMTPSRHRTLRETIAWSYNLLDPAQQAVFRRLGVFAGGADLDAITAVCGDLLEDVDPLDLIAHLVDASLGTIGQDKSGEPRVGMLETIRVFARDQWQEHQEEARSRSLHAAHYAAMVERHRPMVEGSIDQMLQANDWLQVEHDNIREALEWTLRGEPGRERDMVTLGLELCLNLENYWKAGGYYAEAQRWLQRAVECSDHPATPTARELTARCLSVLGMVQAMQGQIPAARKNFEQAVTLSRQLDEKGSLAKALSYQGILALRVGQATDAYTFLEEAISLAHGTGATEIAEEALEALALTKASQNLFEAALEHVNAAIGLAVQGNSQSNLLQRRHNKGCILRAMGRVTEAQALMRDQMPEVVQSAVPNMLIAVAEDYGCVLAELGRHEEAVRLLGAADAMRKRHLVPRDMSQQAEIEPPYATTRAALTDEAWQCEHQRGQDMAIEDVLTEARDGSPSVARR